MITSNQFHFLVGAFVGEMLMAGCILLILKEVRARFETVAKDIRKEFRDEIRALKGLAFTKQDVTVYPIKAAEMRPAAYRDRSVTVRNSAGKLIDVYVVPKEAESIVDPL